MISCLRHILRALLISIVLMTATACAHPATSHALLLSISNELGRTIAEVRMKPCGDLEIAFVLVEESRIGAGETRGIELPPTCVDVVAFDTRGRIVGEQRELNMLPGASWVLRR